MWLAWTAYENGTGPHPGHSRAVHPSKSRHTSGLGLDSDEWTDPAFVVYMAGHGWIRTAASDPTERHHFEYQWWNDQHRNDPTPTSITDPEEDPEMKDKYMWMRRDDGVHVNAIYNTISGYFQAFESNDGGYNTAKAQGHDLAGPTFQVSPSDFESTRAACAEVRGRR